MSEREPSEVDDIVTLLRGVGHQLRQPAFALNLYATLLTSLQDRSDEVRDAADGVLEVSHALHGLVDDIVELGEIASHTPRAARVSLATLVRDRWETVADPQQATLTLDGLGDISSDLELLTQIVGALVDNAVHHAEDGKAQLDVRCAMEREGLELVFADRGPGVPAAERQRIFSPFIRLNSRRPSRGMGLARALLAARRLGGSLRCDERAGGGAQFLLHLPRTF